MKRALLIGFLLFTSPIWFLFLGSFGMALWGIPHIDPMPAMQAQDAVLQQYVAGWWSGIGPDTASAAKAFVKLITNMGNIAALVICSVVGIALLLSFLYDRVRPAHWPDVDLWLSRTFVAQPNEHLKWQPSVPKTSEENESLLV